MDVLAHFQADNPVILESVIDVLCHIFRDDERDTMGKGEVLCKSNVQLVDKYFDFYQKRGALGVSLLEGLTRANVHHDPIKVFQVLNMSEKEFFTWIGVYEKYHTFSKPSDSARTFARHLNYQYPNSLPPRLEEGFVFLCERLQGEVYSPTKVTLASCLLSMYGKISKEGNMIVNIFPFLSVPTEDKICKILHVEMKTVTPHVQKLDLRYCMIFDYVKKRVRLQIN